MAKKKKLPPGVRERDGRFTFRYSVDITVNGVKKRKQKESKSFSTIQEAIDFGIMFKAKRLDGKLVDEKTITLGTWNERWLEDYEIEREPHHNTLRSRKAGLVAIEKYFSKTIKLKDILPDDYQRYLNSLKKDNRKQNTIKSYHNTARTMFADAVRKKLISENPAAHAIVPAFKQTLEEIESGIGELPKYLEKEQLKHFFQILRFVGIPQDYNFFLVLAYTGLRIGELSALKKTDFSEAERTLSITKTLTVSQGISNYLLGPPKNKTSIRKVSLGDTVIKVIKSQIRLRDQLAKDRDVQTDEGFIFWSLRKPGYPVCYSYLAKKFKFLLDKAELPLSLTPHSLRHTHVSLLAEAGVDLAVIQERLGHKNDNITRLVYLHVTEGQRKIVPDKFEYIMNS
ncbi:site-specific integrase [Paenibacillus polymyxa]|uniref:tyrosine-type recombinase/integrase n=1 Tax=Paenibacillus polymyxa TaxID=1406 RepID=UPI0009BE6ED8|nr:tyrosine-type recombinase/integrase [Paenibacillus polymyxa]AUJ88410.1 site-specific integrase [Paenibacillus polymyxa]